jgi:hypothetical protein
MQLPLREAGERQPSGGCAAFHASTRSARHCKRKPGGGPHTDSPAIGRKGWPVKVHTNGDAAIDQLFEAMKPVVAKHGVKLRQVILIHGQFKRCACASVPRGARRVCHIGTTLSAENDGPTSGTVTSSPQPSSSWPSSS